MAHRNWLVRMILIFAVVAIATATLKKPKRLSKQDLSTSPLTYYGYRGYSSAPRHPFLSLLYPQSHSQQSYLVYSPSSYPSYGHVTNEILPGPRPSLPAPLPAYPGLPRPAVPTPPPVCPANFNPICRPSVYRTFDGSCNNQAFPTWGAANTKYSRILPPNYSDGIHAPPLARSGNPLPLAREISFTLFPDVDIQDPLWTLVAMQWGQIMTHDMAMFDGSSQTKHHMSDCCTNEGRLIREALSSPLCYPIIIPQNDPIYFNRECRNFVRSTTDFDRGCTPPYEPAEQLNVASHYLDLSLVYGSSDDVAAGLRTFIGGQLITDVRNRREWLPQATNKSGICDVQNEFEICYRSGDTRVNQNPQLTILQLYLHKEHNRIARQLAQLNPHWSDETIYQEARRINIAVYQQISYYEWLPIFIGLQNSYNRKILYTPEFIQKYPYINDYDPSVDASTINEHSTAAFRYFHSLIAGRLLLVPEHREALTYGALRLSDHFNRPGVIEHNNFLDDLTRGMSYQPQERSDQFFDSEITKFLFRGRERFGGDLRAIDVHRSRDHGLSPYNLYRKLAGLRRAVFWHDLSDSISPENIEKLSQLYESPDDVDLTVGGSLEKHVEGTLVGPTFLYILSEQFWRTRVGDRFWYETGNKELAFTVEQLAEIRKGSMARLLCDHSDVQFMQLRAFERVSDSNPLVSCRDVPSVNLLLWKDIRVPEVVIPGNYYVK